MKPHVGHLPYLPESWQSSTYQQAIWKARRRIVGKEEGEISDAESKVLKQLLGPLTKPDFSRWIQEDNAFTGDKHFLHIPTRKIPAKLQSSSRTSIVGSKLSSYSAVDGRSPSRNLPSEYIALSDQIQIQPVASASQTAVDISTTYDNFGLCMACFHQKGPHQHYQAPIRTGGGYTIYHRNTLSPEDLSWATIKWLQTAEGEREIPTEKDEASVIGQFGGDFTSELYNEFLSRGGDISALEEYLESNFSEDVLSELQESGVDVELVLEYSLLYRQHIKKLLRKNIKSQSKLSKQLGDDVEYATLYSEIESSGTDMENLVTLITQGRDCDEILRFEAKGGNVEILEFFAGEIDKAASRDQIVSCFLRLQENDRRHRNVASFLEYLDSGGDLDELKEYVESRVRSGSLDSQNEEHNLMKKFLSNFPDQPSMLRGLTSFSTEDKRLYEFAQLLQRLIESGGNIKLLKHLVKNGCNPQVVPTDVPKEAKDAMMVIGETISSDEKLCEDLEAFPDDPYVTEAYIRRGGSFPALVRAISLAVEEPKLESYVKARTSEAIHKYRGTEKGKDPATLSNSPISLPPSSVLSVHVLPKLLVKAKADLVYDELVTSQKLWKKNEGRFILKAVKQGQQVADHDRSFVSGVDISNRKLITDLFQKSRHQHPTPPVSSITGRRRDRLWVTPKPFEIKRNRATLTRPLSPFSRNRDIRISSLTEDHILGVEKKQRDQLDFIKRSLRVEDFQKNWQFAITTPRGSIVAANSEHPENLPITTHQITTPVAQEVKKDRKSRRRQHREKMRALKQETHGSGGSGRLSSLSGDRTPSPNVLLVPKVGDGKDKWPVVPEITFNEEFSSPGSPEENSVDSEERVFAAHQKDKDSDENSNASTDVDVTKSSPRFATAFGGKKASSSLSNLSTVKELRKMRDDPTTLMEAFSPRATLASKSESAIRTLPPKVPESNQTWKELSDKMLKKRSSHQAPVTKTVEEAESSSSDEDDDENNVVDILKQYCIVRESRIPFYKRIFEKYVLVKSLRDRENRMMVQRKDKAHQEQQEISYGFTAGDFQLTEGSPKFELGKNRFIMDKIKDNIEDLQSEIVAAKVDLKRTIASVARREFPDVIKAALERHKSIGKDRQAPVFGYRPKPQGGSPEPGSPTSACDVTSRKELSDDAVIRLLAPHMRLQCESQVEVRDRKVSLVHLRDKVKRLMTRRRTLAGVCKRLAKEIENDEMDKCMKRKEMEPFVRKQSAIFQELHPTEDPTIDECDLNSALTEIDSTLTHQDNAQLLQGLCEDSGINFRVFCVICALHEKRNLREHDLRSLDLKMKNCKEHYSSLIGTDVEALEMDLAAAGISPHQRQQIIQKLSRGASSGTLPLIDFVTYVPLFIDIHRKIVDNPLPMLS